MKQVTCHDCKNKFKDKVSMMNHKRDSDHPSKKKCNKFPDCERAEECWYKHCSVMPPQIPQVSSQKTTHLACNVCKQIFSERNDLMFHKKRVHPSDIVCSNFLAGYCRRGTSGENCWYNHDQLATAATNVARPTLSLPPPGSTSWETDFPLHPAMDQRPMVGLQQQVWAMMHQQQEKQQQQQQQLSMIMNQIMNLNMQ